MGGGGLKGCFRNFEGQIRKSSKREKNMKKKKKTMNVKQKVNKLATSFSEGWAGVTIPKASKEDIFGSRQPPLMSPKHNRAVITPSRAMHVQPNFVF